VPDYVRVDEKTPAEHLEFVRRLAAHLNFINNRNEVAGNWSPFYRGQAAVVVARLLAWPISRLGQRLAEYRELIEDHQNLVPRPQLLLGLFDLLTSAIVNLDGLITNLPVDSPLREKAEALVKYQLSPALERWLAYYQAAEGADYFDALGADAVPAYLHDAYAAGGKLISTDNLIAGDVPLHERWTNGDAWTDYLLRIGEDPIVFGTTTLGTDINAEILHAVGHTYFHGVYESFVSSALHLRTGAQKEWELLQNNSGHAPQLALLLTFLEVRQQQQEMLNGLTDRHLDYYYRRVLRTQPAAARPPHALLHLEARKNVPVDYLPAGTAFRGGKDPVNETTRLFVSEEAVTLSLAKIVAKRALFKVAAQPNVYDFPGENRTVVTQADRGRLYAAEVVDSADGTGEVELPETANGWHPFGYRAPDNGRLEAGMTPARVGMAVASHYLYLREGTREVTFTFQGHRTNLLSGQALDVHLTTEEGWLTRREVVNDQGEISFTLGADEPAILPYNEEIHQEKLATDLPVVKFELPHDAGDYAYNLLRVVWIRRVAITLEVEGVRQMALSGSAGTLDNSGPFYPFGPAPRPRSVMHIINREALQKAGTQVTVNWTWQSAPTNNWLGLSKLRNGTFQSRTWLETDTDDTGSISRTIHASDVLDIGFEEDTAFMAGQNSGALELQLWWSYGHAEYPAKLAGWTADEAPAGGKPPLPFNPEFSDFYLDYEVNGLDSNAARNVQQETTAYFSLEPFGTQEQPSGLAWKRFIPKSFSRYLGGADAGAIYVGLEQWTPGTQLSLLVQIAEGTADPLLEKPEDHLLWEYLNDNSWTSFANDKLADGTDGFLRSGIVRLDLPTGVTATNTVFGDELQWLRISAVGNTDAVNYLQGIHVNGVAVVQALTEGQTATSEPLPAGTISKLLLPKPGVKKVNQPYASFDGAGEADRDAYFTCLSERLRHKDRGLMEWDVERLVLKTFPEVERVICLNHLEFRPALLPGTHVYNELRAGHFTVLPMGRSGGDGLRPYVSLATREAIEVFLADRISCHATLHVRNPLFEEVKVTADVRFIAGTDEAWALGKINEDLIEHLSPWHNSGLEGIDFSAEVHRAVVVNFLEELPYVDYVKNLVLRQLGDDTQNGGERLHSTKLVSVLASVSNHVFNPLGATDAAELPEVCTPARRSRRAQLITETPEA
jgi:hypothetical protein